MCGVDEVGCGLFVGLVVVVVVIFDLVWLIDGFDDLKVFFVKKCDLLYDLIVVCLYVYCVVLVSVDEIDMLNILYVMMFVMK